MMLIKYHFIIILAMISRSPYAKKHGCGHA